MEEALLNPDEKENPDKLLAEIEKVRNKQTKFEKLALDIILFKKIQEDSRR
jgi:hypothetical protein